MEQLVYLGPGKAAWRQAPEPRLTTGVDAIVEPLAVATCDMDGVVLGGQLRMPSPTPLGHDGIGRVVAVGGEVRIVAVGDLVALPWKISCGRCDMCRRGRSAHCSAVPTEAAYGWHREPVWGGFLADRVRVPYADAMLIALPPEADPVRIVGIGDNVTDAWRAVGPTLRARPGGTALVVGGRAPGSIGLLAAGLAVALGSRRVLYVDDDPGRCTAAARCGVEAVDRDPGDLSGLPLFDVTVDASGSPRGFEATLDRTAPAGVCTSTAAIVYRGQPVTIDLHETYRRSVTVQTGWVDTVDTWREPLGLLVEGRFDPLVVTDAIVRFEDAAAALCAPFTRLVVAR